MTKSSPPCSTPTSPPANTSLEQTLPLRPRRPCKPASAKHPGPQRMFRTELSMHSTAWAESASPVIKSSCLAARRGTFEMQATLSQRLRDKPLRSPGKPLMLLALSRTASVSLSWKEPTGDLLRGSSTVEGRPSNLSSMRKRYVDCKRLDKPPDLTHSPPCSTFPIPSVSSRYCSSRKCSSCCTMSCLGNITMYVFVQCCVSWPDRSFALDRSRSRRRSIRSRLGSARCTISCSSCLRRSYPSRSQRRSRLSVRLVELPCGVGLSGESACSKHHKGF